jgi:hypothetical protein
MDVTDTHWLIGSGEHRNHGLGYCSDPQAAIKPARWPRRCIAGGETIKLVDQGPPTLLKLLV